MPRISNEGPEVLKWSSATGNGSSTFDVCKYCAEQALGLAPWSIGLVLHNSGEPEGELDQGADHPDYEGEGYICVLCGDALTEEDD